MSMTKAELMEAFREAASAEFAGFSPNESDYTYEFSARFERRMDRLIRAESRPTWRFVNTNPRRLIIIVVAVVMALFAVACAVPEIRESIAGFFVRVFSDHAEITTPEANREMIDDVYELSPIPDGFYLKNRTKSDAVIITEYSNSVGDYIILDQSIYDFLPLSIDTEHGEYTTCVIGEKTVFLHFSKNYTQAIWTENNYIFHLRYLSQVDIDVFTSWISFVKHI